jgi:hypothetical protein
MAQAGFQELSALLKPKLEELEAHRVELRTKATKWTTRGILGTAFSLPICFLHMPTGLILAAICLIIGLAIRAYQGTKFSREFKSRIMPVIVDTIHPGMSYSPNSGVSIGEFEKSRLYLTHPDRYRCEDYFQGEIGKTSIRFSEVHAEKKHESRDSHGRKSTSYTTIFRGLFFVVDFNKHFSGETYILADNSEGIFGRFARKLQKWNWSRPDLIELEDPEFEKVFKVFSTDQVEGRYIVTPHFMRLLLDLKTKAGATPCISFLDNAVYVAIPNSKDFFEFKFSQSLLDDGALKSLVDQLQFCTSIVDDLELNTRIWSKE